MKSDMRIKTDVSAELQWDPAVSDGVIPRRHLEVRLAPANPQDIRGGMAAAVTRYAQREANRISIDVDGIVVTLRGTVNSLAQSEAALGTATAVQSVTRVVDRLDVAA